MDSDQISTSIRLINSFSLKSNDFDEKYDKNDTNSIKLYDFVDFVSIVIFVSKLSYARSEIIRFDQHFGQFWLLAC